MPSSLDPLAVGALIVGTLAAAAPDFNSPAIVPFAVVVGGLVGAGIGRLRGVGRNRVREIAENWAFAAGILAGAIYLVTLLTGV